MAGSTQKKPTMSIFGIGLGNLILTYKEIKMTEEEIKRKKLKDDQDEEDRKRRNSDDDNSFTGSAITDGLLGIPSSGLAIAIDMATPGGMFD